MDAAFGFKSRAHGVQAPGPRFNPKHLLLKVLRWCTM